MAQTSSHRTYTLKLAASVPASTGISSHLDDYSNELASPQQLNQPSQRTPIEQEHEPYRRAKGPRPERQRFGEHLVDRVPHLDPA